MPVDFQYAIPIKLTDEDLKGEKGPTIDTSGNYAVRLSDNNDIEEKFGPGMRA